MREKYDGLSLASLREMAKARGMRGISALKKEALINRMLQQDEIDEANQAQRKEAAAAEEQAKRAAEEKAKRAAEEQARREAEEKAKRAAEEQARREAEEKAKKAAEEQARREAEEKAKKAAEAQAQSEAEARTHRSGDNQTRRTAEGNGTSSETHNRRDNEDRRRPQEDRYRREDRGNRREDNSRPQDQVRERSREYAQSRPGQKNTRVFNAGNLSAAGGMNRRKAFRPENSAAAERTAQKVYGSSDRNYEEEMDHSQPVRQEQDIPQIPEDPEQLKQIQEADAQLSAVKEDLSEIDSGNQVTGILEIIPDGYGFIRSDNYLPGESDVYVSPSQIRRFNLKTGDIISGNTRVKTEKEKFSALLYVTSVNGYHPSEAQRRPAFENLTPIFPNKRLYMERPGGSIAMRVVDLVSPIGKGQRGMIVSQPKAGKTTLLKEIAKSICYNNPDMHLIILLIDERPEEVTDMKEAIQGDNVEVIYSTFDETPEHHRRVSEMVIERAKRLVEHKEDVIILLDSITRLARAYNLTCQPTGRTLSGGLDPGALHMPKRFFGAARNMREGGSLTVLATALVDTGSKMDDVVFEEFKGTGNMELVLDRKLSEKRIFPAIDIVKSGTRREDLLLNSEEQEAVDVMRKAFNGMRSDEAVENILTMFSRTGSNKEFIELVRKNRIL